MSVRTWRLADSRQSLILAAAGDRLPEVVHWGAPLPEGDDDALLASLTALDVTGGMLDENPDLSICPEASRTFPGQPGLILRAEDGTPLLPRFRYVEEDAGDGLTLTYADRSLGLVYGASLDLDPETHVLRAQAFLSSARPVHLHWLAAPVLPGPQASDGMIDVAGRWTGEFQFHRTPWTPGIRYRENRTGRTGHEHFPALIALGPGTTNTAGEAWGLHYGWSGGHRMIAEELADGRRQIQFGHAGRTETAPGTEFRTAPLYATYGTGGLNAVGTAFQRHLRDRIVRWPDPSRPRPVHYNCWEAVYFDHDYAVLAEIAERAADLGAERFVLDDGWFGARDDDTSSLGDWTVDPRKWPDGLTPLVDKVHALGMSFGLWFEPEMVNPDSDLLRAHPDWAMGGDDQTLGRFQKVLDMSREDVCDYLFEAMSAVLSAHEIDYVKWDHNRVLPAPDAAQTRGSYALLDRLAEAFPALEIETCASGGGRIDFGILRRTQRVWLSDCNDAIERIRMQHDAALFLPMVVTGSHVGPRRSHTTGRTLDMHLRAWTAAQRHMGFEMDPRELTDAEADILRGVTAWWKSNRHWLARSDILRLDAPDPSVTAEQQMEPGGDRFVVFAAKTEASAQIAPRPLRLTRLDPDSRWRVSLRDAPPESAQSRGPLPLRDGSVEVSGAWLTGHGLTLPWTAPQTMQVIEGERL